MQETEYQTLDT